MVSQRSRFADSLPALLVACSVPLVTGMVFVFFQEALSYLFVTYLSSSKDETWIIRMRTEIAARWAAPLLNVCLTAWVLHRLHVRRAHSRPEDVVKLAAATAASFLVLALVFGFRFSFALGELRLSAWYSVGVVLTFAAGIWGGFLGRRQAQRRTRIARILEGTVAGIEGVRAAIAEYARFAAVPAVYAKLDGRAQTDCQPHLERRRLLFDQAGERIAAQFPAGAPDDLAAVGVSRLSPDLRRSLAAVGIWSFALLPLRAAEGVARDFVVLFLSRPAFLVRDEWQFRLLASQLALRLENARLLDAARQSAVLEERQRLAREIHDTIAQDLIGIVVNLEALERSDAGDPGRHAASVREAVRTARRGLEETRRLVWALRPTALDEHPLPIALARWLHDWSSRSGVRVEFLTEGVSCRLTPNAEITLLRMLQEACSNVARHARAGHVRVGLCFEPDAVVLSIRDDGVGLDARRGGGSGFGLAAMRERVEAIGGTLTVRGEAGAGTELSARIPRDDTTVPEEDDGADSRADRG